MVSPQNGDTRGRAAPPPLATPLTCLRGGLTPRWSVLFGISETQAN